MSGSGTSESAALCRLDTAEIVLLWCLRQRLAEGGDSPLLAEGLRRAFGVTEAGDAAKAFETAYLALANHLVRDFEMMPPGCGCLSEDEVLLLQLCASVQHAPMPRALAAARALVGPLWAGPLCRRFGRFLRVMAGADLHLPQRAPVPPRGHAITYH